MQRRAKQNQTFIPSLDAIDRRIDRSDFDDRRKKRGETVDFETVHRQDPVALFQFVACVRQFLEFADDRALSDDAGRHHHPGENQNPEHDACDRAAGCNDRAVPQRSQDAALVLVDFRRTFLCHGSVVEYAVRHAHVSAEGNPSECPFRIRAVAE